MDLKKLFGVKTDKIEINTEQNTYNDNLKETSLTNPFLSNASVRNVIDILYHGKDTNASDNDICDLLENQTLSWEEHESLCDNFTAIHEFLNRKEPLPNTPLIRLSCGLTTRQSTCAELALKQMSEGRKADAVHEFIDVVTDYMKNDLFPNYSDSLNRRLSYDEVIFIENLAYALSLIHSIG